MATLPIRNSNIYDLAKIKNKLKSLGKLGLLFELLYILMAIIGIFPNGLIAGLSLIVFSIPLFCLWIKLPSYLAKRKLESSNIYPTQHYMDTIQKQHDCKSRLNLALINLDNISNKS